MKTKTIGLVIRENIIEQLKKRKENSFAYFFVGFNNVKSSFLCQLRNDLRPSQSYVFVAKNSLIRKAFAGGARGKMEDYLQGETAVIFAYNEDIVALCKAIVEFSKENKGFLIKGGVSGEEEISKEELEALAKLPSRGSLRAQAVSAIAGPLTGFLACLNQVILKFVWVAEEIRKVQSQDKDKEKPEEEQEGKKEDKSKESKENKEEKRSKEG